MLTQTRWKIRRARPARSRSAPEVERQALRREDDLALVDPPDVADALFHDRMTGEIGANVREDEPPDAGRLGHAGGARGPALAASLAIGVHRVLVVPAHAHERVGAPRQVDDALAGLRVAGEDDAASR